MRITRPPNKPIENYEQYRIAANIGCDKCPYCAAEGIYNVVDGSGYIEYLSDLSYVNHKVLIYDNDDTYTYHLVNKDIRVDKYKCKVCGAEWISEPYERR